MANSKYDGLTEVGVASLGKDDIKPSPLLDDAGDYEYITLLNPLPFTFRGQVALSRQVNAPMRIGSSGPGGVPVDEGMLAQSGLSLRNPDFQVNSSFTHVVNEVVIAPGETKNILGPEAKVIVRQLVNEILGYRNQVTLRGNPVGRRRVEEEIVVARRPLEDLAGNLPQTPDQWAHEAVEKSNEEAFPSLKEDKEEPKAKK